MLKNKGWLDATSNILHSNDSSGNFPKVSHCLTDKDEEKLIKYKKIIHIPQDWPGTPNFNWENFHLILTMCTYGTRRVYTVSPFLSTIVMMTGSLNNQRLNPNFFPRASSSSPNTEDVLLRWRMTPVSDATAKIPANKRKEFFQPKTSTKACRVGPRIIVPIPCPAVTIPRANDRFLRKYWYTMIGETT